MPAQSRAQRRRANAAAQQRRPSAPQPYETAELAADQVATPTAPLAAAAPAPAASSRVARRLRSGTARTPEPIDYTKEYGFVASDLRLIALWTVLLFVAMFALYFARSNGMF
ncbi:hypothetical protein F8S13_17530 [Chloroflexia bacterium SDU3-3]|nr:hypothetical protein F8S13_17530 [Chloroflexia bacterium SDU3-3]